MREADMVRLDIVIANDFIEDLARVVHRDAAFYVGRELTKKLKDSLPRQNFEVVI